MVERLLVQSIKKQWTSSTLSFSVPIQSTGKRPNSGFFDTATKFFRPVHHDIHKEDEILKQQSKQYAEYSKMLGTNNARKTIRLLVVKSVQ
ncbi:hypothetical protein KIN20_032304 [Parelaphostrongylus tenuis]|uniref:Uncharacterized protein n=1 Tax=Parelaphostrongylus tenuis TaxID=148309 RepID=A0AAD5R6V7_PARTN|nr:hypothetical protein KIN20_032304 [Parelaphostrongylus tenuis]